MIQYLQMLEYLLTHGKDRPDRTGVGTRGVFGYQMRFDMEEGFPLLTTKKIHVKSVIHELLWFLSGSSNIAYLKENGVTIWDEWADANGELGPVYGVQWRKWQHHTPVATQVNPQICSVQVIDQINQLVLDLQKNPFSRRHIVTAWNPGAVPQMKLPPCHCFFQCYVQQDSVDETVKHLSLHLYMRSTDAFLGLPFNIASYAFLLHMLAYVTQMRPSELVISFGDLHLYRNHFEQAKAQLSRKPRQAPELELIPGRPVTMDTWRYEDFRIISYEPLPAIPAPIAV
jgi:thymidylate synthase